MFPQIALLVIVILVMSVLFSRFSSETDHSSPGLMSLVFGFSLFVGIASFCLALTYFQKADSLLNFLTAFTMLVILPASLSSTAISVINIRNLRETLASA
jgi:FtsH-binding integral membrane protein